MTVDEFIDTTLPETIIGKKKILTAVFSTYNDITDYESEEVRTGKKGLTIHVHVGGSVPDMNRIFSTFEAIVAGDRKTAGLLTDEGIRQSTDAQTKVENDLLHFRNLHRRRRNLLFVIYAGLNAFDEAISSVNVVRADFRSAFIAVLTCNCDRWTKVGILNPLLQNKTVNAVIETRFCGGRQDMKLILEALVERWGDQQERKGS